MSGNTTIYTYPDGIQVLMTPLGNGKFKVIMVFPPDMDEETAQVRSDQLTISFIEHGVDPFAQED